MHFFLPWSQVLASMLKRTGVLCQVGHPMSQKEIYKPGCEASDSPGKEARIGLAMKP